MESVVREILDGNKEKFREIVRKYNPDFLRIAFHFSGNWEDAKDITQTTFIRTYRFLGRFRQGRRFEPWIYRIHLNNCKSTARKLARQRKRHVELDSVELPSTGSAEESVAPSTLIVSRILSLSPKQRLAFILIEIEGYSQIEAAERLGCRESTLRVHLARAKANLREKLRSIGVSDDE